MRLFKYLKREHAAGLLSLGSIRIGTLEDFRKSEHKRGVADPTEGTKSVVARVAKHIQTNDPDDKEAFRKFIGGTFYGTLTAGPGLNLQNNQTSPDCFVLCFSLELSRSVQKEFDDVGACVEITHPDRFFAALTNVLNAFAPVNFEGVHQISYRERAEHHDITRLTQLSDAGKGLHPALIKEPHFGGQKELRAVWTPRAAGSLTPRILCVPALIQFCNDVTSKL